MAALAQTRRPISQTFYAPSLPISTAPAGTFAPGTKVQVGGHRVVIEKYLSEGGFSHVYTVKLPAPEHGVAVLKRVAVPDKETLANMRNEVETMKKLKGQKSIVTYIDSHASQLKGGGYEVFLLMEFCSGGGLIDFMNTRLKNRLTEPEILDIFGDTAEGVACMHYLKPPLIHRDLKVENILITRAADGRKRYKLCDFGSAAPPRPAASSAAEGRLIEEDVQRHTTLQYRSPEMIDVYRHKPIDEKSDVWALGVLLYKLCYYTTPFEDRGQMAILSASFKYPAYPPFSDQLKKLIAIMLMEDSTRRPNIYQIVKEVSQMRGKECPIPDIYSKRTQSEARSTQQLPPREANVKSPPMVGAKIEAPQETQQFVPEVKPMRRGRLAAPSQQAQATRPTSMPNTRMSPSLDSKSSPLVEEDPPRRIVANTISKFDENSTSLANAVLSPKLGTGSLRRINVHSTPQLNPRSTPKMNIDSATKLNVDSSPNLSVNTAPRLDASSIARSNTVSITKPNPSSTLYMKRHSSVDPFAALDSALTSRNVDNLAKAVEDLSLKYPPLDDFSALESRGKFNFRGEPPKVPSKPQSLRGRKCLDP